MQNYRPEANIIVFVIMLDIVLGLMAVAVLPSTDMIAAVSYMRQALVPQMNGVGAVAPRGSVAIEAFMQRQQGPARLPLLGHALQLGRIGNGISLLFVYLLRMTEYQSGAILIEEVVWLGLRAMPVEVVRTAPR